VRSARTRTGLAKLDVTSRIQLASNLDLVRTEPIYQLQERRKTLSTAEIPGLDAMN